LPFYKIGLHVWPGTALVVVLAILALLVFGFLSLKRNNPEVAGIAAPLLAFLAFLILTVGGVIIVAGELGLDSRDAAIKSRLKKAGIEVVGLQSWDRQIVVRAGDCTATYTIQTAVDLQATTTTVWPLVANSGRAVSGCEGTVLDDRFIRYCPMTSSRKRRGPRPRRSHVQPKSLLIMRSVLAVTT
jgi:hypothetical protein